MLTNLASVRQVPGFNNSITKTDAWLTSLIASADRAIQQYCKQNLELANYGVSATPGTFGDSGYYNGNLEQSLVLRQGPAWSGTTTLDPSMNGLPLPQSSITVLSVLGFNPNGGAFAVQNGVNSFAAVTYTGISGLTFTGCSGGTGTLNSNANYNAVGTPVVWVNQVGSFGTNPNGFSSSKPLAPGINYALYVDGVDLQGNPISKRSLLQRVGGGGSNFGFGGYCDQYGGGGKLAARSVPVWERGQGNIMVAYAAGYYNAANNPPVPYDLQYACNTLVANMVRLQPNGTDLSSEGLGSYSYSVLQRSLDAPALGSLSNTLGLYRDASI